MNLWKSIKFLTPFEVALWVFSVVLIAVPPVIFKSFDVVSVVGSVIGITALIFCAKADPLGQFLTAVFSIFYSIVSLRFHYYGEMITYLFMSAPMAVFSGISWIKHRYSEERPETKIEKLGKKDIVLMIVYATAVTGIFYFILKYFNTANLFFSTVSVTTSFFAVYLLYKRSPLYALAYATNDVVLIILWVMATAENIEYLPMVICFFVFFLNDIYAFVNWGRIKKNQI